MGCEDKAWKGQVANRAPHENWNKGGMGEKAIRRIKIDMLSTNEVSLSFCLFTP